MKINDVILQTVAKVVVFIILTLGVYIFLAGHHNPGGGFVGGLVLASALVLLYLSFDIKTVHKGLPFDFKLIAALGAFTVVAAGVGALFFNESFLTQTFLSLTWPIVGKMGVSTVTIFEAGVALAVVGVVITIILSISEDV